MLSSTGMPGNIAAASMGLNIGQRNPHVGLTLLHWGPLQNPSRWLRPYVIPTLPPPSWHTQPWKQGQELGLPGHQTLHCLLTNQIQNTLPSFA